MTGKCKTCGAKLTFELYYPLYYGECFSCRAKSLEKELRDLKLINDEKKNDFDKRV